MLNKLLTALICTTLLSSCVTISGFQTYDVPKQGEYTTNLGTIVQVIPINHETLPLVEKIDLQKNINYADLFNKKNHEYKLSYGDVLSIQLWNYPEIAPPLNSNSNNLSIQAYGYSIDQSGYIQLPLIGRYLVAGKTLFQLNQDLHKKFAHYLRSPDVIVRVISYQGQSFSVQGSVEKAGRFYLSDQPTSIYAAIGMAGGMNPVGDANAITLIRDGKTYQLNSVELEESGYSLNKIFLQFDDTIYVNTKENNKIYLIGEAGLNKALAMRDQGISLSDVLGEGMGINPNSANSSKIYIVRNDEKQQKTMLYHMDLSNIGDIGLANKFFMKRNDIVYVDATGLARWQRVINQVVPLSGIVNAAANAANK